MHLTLPNLLTILRLIAAPGIVFLFLWLPRPWADMAALVLFGFAALTDWIDGHLARRWAQVTKLGTMLDPIADKAMVVIALLVIAVLTGIDQLPGIAGFDPLIIIPATLIVFREVFVSGLREFLGDTAGTLKVTRIAKWKTATQMIAISVLFAQGIAAHYLGMWTWGMDAEMAQAVLAGQVEDTLGIRLMYYANMIAAWGGLILLWLAAILTLLSGADYFLKAMPFLREDA
jgi:cardiolipin synthase (CMP-forming)